MASSIKELQKYLDTFIGFTKWSSKMLKPVSHGNKELLLVLLLMHPYFHPVGYPCPIMLIKYTVRW